MTARARSQLARSRAHSAHTAASPIGCGNGRPHTAHQGGAKNVIAAQHWPHSASGSPTTVPQARQRGGRTPSTRVRATWRNRAGRVAERFIGTNHSTVIRCRQLAPLERGGQVGPPAPPPPPHLFPPRGALPTKPPPLP